MCGIIAYKGNKNCIPILLNGLEYLEYRGYDSAGLCFINDSGLNTIKTVGHVSNLKNQVNKQSYYSRCGMGHTRWATHGKPCVRNSHPHCTSDNKLSLVHNGIIENYSEIKKDLEDTYSFASDTDSEVLLYLIYSFVEQGNNLLDSVKLALDKVVGAYAIVVLSNDGSMVAARKGSPLAIGLGNDEIIVASDSSCFNNIASNGVVYLKDNTVVEIKKDLEIFDMSNGIEIDYEIEKVYNEILQVGRGSYESYMLKEIYEQPKTISDCLSGRIDGYKIKLGGLIGYEKIFKKSNHITILACGSSYYAGLVGKYYIEEFCKIKVNVEYSSEFKYRQPCINHGDIVIGISQSGETADTIGALEIAKKSGAIIVGICNVPNSTLSRMTDCGVFLKSGVEVGVASTKTFTNQILCLLLLTLWIEQVRGDWCDNKRKTIIEDLKSLSDTIENLLKHYDDIESLAIQFQHAKNCLFLGRGYNFPIAMEGALKLKEISYVHAEGYAAAEMKHGPLALIDDSVPIVVIANQSDQYDKLMNNIKEIQARNGKVIAICSNFRNLGDFKIKVPLVCDVLTPIMSVIPLQLFAYYSAKARGKNVDKPRNLAKSVTVE